jgi:hypothetical protein
MFTCGEQGGLLFSQHAVQGQQVLHKHVVKHAHRLPASAGPPHAGADLFPPHKARPGTPAALVAVHLHGM